MTRPADIWYRLRLRLPAGEEIAAGSYKARRAREVGEAINLPVGPDGESKAGKGYIWRVQRIDDHTLVLDFIRPHPEMEA